MTDLSGENIEYQHWNCGGWNAQEPWRCCGGVAKEGPCAGHCQSHCRWYCDNRPLAFERGTRSEKEWDHFYRVQFLKHGVEYHGREDQSNKKKQFAFTLTTNGDDVAEEEEKLREAVEKIFRQQTVPVYEGAAYLEYTEAGRPHIHGYYETNDGGRIFAKVFKRCWPLWGETRGHTKFAGGYHEQMKTNRYKGYMAAEGRVVCTVEKGEYKV